ncbi:cysteine-rich CWC family protein [Veronia pacifica]|uniref:cysteine-rich CWC family protein n=1 Tax=Veronia pacifica TaxID=1080227 RepID=UPI0009F4C443|nr:cysteine-rich CWC family protein [Veronia pacifica]
MKSPCIGSCKSQGGICSGCHRTMDEIVNWVRFSEIERQEVMDALSGQLTTGHCIDCGQPLHCDISAGKNTCWCFSLDQRDTSDTADSDACLCRKCLSKKPVLV